MIYTVLNHLLECWNLFKFFWNNFQGLKTTINGLEASHMWKEFRQFALRGNLLDLTIGFIIGTAFSKVATSIVSDILMPPLGLLIGKVDFSNLYINLSDKYYVSFQAAKAAGAPTINIGSFLNNIVDFLVIAIVMFYVVRQSNKAIKEIFIFFYEKLLGYTTFNKAFFNTSNSLSDFRALMSLNKVCPYCDITKIDKDLVSVDHFLPKSKLPVLSIYPENLIVSCKACNESIKGEKIKIPIAHPYYEELADYFVFKIDESDSSAYKIEIQMIEGNSGLINKKVENFLELFEIKKRYEINMTAELKLFRSEIRKNAKAELNGIAQCRSINRTDIERCIQKYFKESFIDNKKRHRAADGTKIKNDYINQIIQSNDYQSDIDYLESYFYGLRSSLMLSD